MCRVKPTKRAHLYYIVAIASPFLRVAYTGTHEQRTPNNTDTWTRTLITSINDYHDQRNQKCFFSFAQCPIGNSDSLVGMLSIHYPRVMKKMRQKRCIDIIDFDTSRPVKLCINKKL